MKNYSFEKGKHGGITGSIFPFFTDINGLLPLDQDYKEYCPAGFLKCRGQILQADQFPALAEVLGVGNISLYKKAGTTLQERDADGTGGTFQLPDLGSKYITASSNSGNYLNDTVTNENNIPISRAGIGVTLQGNGDTVEFGFDGDFSAPAVVLSFTGQWRYIQPPSRSNPATLSIGNFVAHGHFGTYTIASRINQNRQALRSCSWGGGGICWRGAGNTFETGGDTAGVEHRFISYADEGEDTDHSHQLGTPELSWAGPTSTIPAVTLSAGAITTTVRMRTRDVIKMDDIAPKFIIVEYLIKF